MWTCSRGIASANVASRAAHRSTTVRSSNLRTTPSQQQGLHRQRRHAHAFPSSGCISKRGNQKTTGDSGRARDIERPDEASGNARRRDSNATWLTPLQHRAATSPAAGPSRRPSGASRACRRPRFCRLASSRRSKSATSRWRRVDLACRASGMLWYETARPLRRGTDVADRSRRRRGGGAVVEGGSQPPPRSGGAVVEGGSRPRRGVPRGQSAETSRGPAEGEKCTEVG